MPKNKHEQPRAVIYARKSTDDKKSRDASLSVSAQLEACRALAKHEGYKVVAEHVDDGISGRCWQAGTEWDAMADADVMTNDYIKKMPKKRRPGFGEVLRMIDKGKADIVLVRDITRFARPLFLSGLQMYTTTFFKTHSKAALHTIQDGKMDFSDDLKILSYFIRDAMEDMSIKTKSKHSLESVRKEREKGRYMAGFAPFGYVYNKHKKLVHDKITAPHVRDLFLNTLKGAGVVSQTKYLNSLGLKTARGNVMQDRLTRNWLKNPLYCGKILFEGRFIDCVDVAEPIIDEDTFFKVHKLFQSRKLVNSNRAKSTGGLASGISSCGLCGYSMILRKNPQGNHSYRCIMNKSSSCPCALNQQNLDEYLSYFISLKDILEYENALDRLKEKDSLPELIALNESINAQITELTDKMRARKIDMDKFIDILDGMKDELAQNQLRIVELQNIPNIDTAKHNRKVYKAKHEDMTLDQKRNAVRVVFKHITVYPDKVFFELNSGETFTIGRVNLGRNRVWLAPVYYSNVQTGENGHLLITHVKGGYAGPKALLKGKLIVSNYNPPDSDDEAKDALREINIKDVVKSRRHPGSRI